MKNPAIYFQFTVIMIVFGLALLPESESAAQTSNDKPCSAPEAGQFDFWVGTWDATWEGGGGENVVSKEFDGCVIRENFRANPDSTSATPLTGTSLSTYVSAEKVWKQTWVDNSGSYLDFSGTFDGERMTLARETKDKEGKSYFQRMVWYNITADNFDWNWERSRDGKEWKVLWQIRYQRRK